MILKIFLLGFTLLFTFGQSSAKQVLTPGAHPEFFSLQGQEEASILLSTGIYGAFQSYIRYLPKEIKGIDVVYQHYQEPCDNRRCTGLSYKVVPAKNGLGFAPGYKLQAGGIAFHFETKNLEHSQEAKKQHSKAYLATSYIVVVRLQEGKEIRYFETP